MCHLPPVHKGGRWKARGEHDLTEDRRPARIFFNPPSKRWIKCLLLCIPKRWERWLRHLVFALSLCYYGKQPNIDNFPRLSKLGVLDRVSWKWTHNFVKTSIQSNKDCWRWLSCATRTSSFAFNLWKWGHLEFLLFAWKAPKLELSFIQIPKLPRSQKGVFW